MANYQITNTVTVPHDYDILDCPASEYVAALNSLFNDVKFRDELTQRHKFHKIMAASRDANAIRKVDSIDSRIGRQLLATMAGFAIAKKRQQNSRRVALDEYFTDFVRTDEQKELYEEFATKINASVVICDVFECILGDAQDALKALDPSIILSEFDSIKAMKEPLRKISSLFHSKANIELSSLFADFTEEIQDMLYPKVAVFNKKYADLHRKLEKDGTLDKVDKKHDDREFIFLRLSDYIYHASVKKISSEEARRKAQYFVNNLTEEEMPAALEFILKLVKEQDAIRMARGRKMELFRTLPNTELTKKLAELQFDMFADGISEYLK